MEGERSGEVEIIHDQSPPEKQSKDDTEKIICIRNLYKCYRVKNKTQGFALFITVF